MASVGSSHSRLTSAEDNEEASLLGCPPIGLLDREEFRTMQPSNQEGLIPGLERRGFAAQLVKRVHCQLGCPDVWQKRHALTTIVPPDSALAFSAAPACVSAAPLYAAIGAFSPGAWRDRKSTRLNSSHTVIS